MSIHILLYIIVALCVGVSKRRHSCYKCHMENNRTLVGKYRTVAGFAQLFLLDTLSLNKQSVSASCCRPRVPQPWPWAKGRDDGSLQLFAC